jgi:cyclic pyranopterin phosphate synthase
MTSLPHLDADGKAWMVDVGSKSETERVAVARGRVTISNEVATVLRAGDIPKGDALAVARVAALAGTKRTADLVPLCHPIALSGAEVDLEVTDESIEIVVTVRCVGRTGVEMEALTGVAVAGLTLIDMIKTIDRSAALTDVRLVRKSGGRSGTWLRDGEAE